MSAAADLSLLVITDRRQAARGLERQVEALVAAGCRWVMLREKDLPAAELEHLGRRLGSILATAGGRLSTNGDAALAARLGADLHLARPEAVAAARPLLATAARIGLSCHNAADLAAAGAAGADYALLSPVFASASKPGYGPPLGLEGLHALSAGAKLPVLALGGVTASNALHCGAAGAAGVAVMGEAMRALDPAALMASLRAALDRDQ